MLQSPSGLSGYLNSHFVYKSFPAAVVTPVIDRLDIDCANYTLAIDVCCSVTRVDDIHLLHRYRLRIP